MDKIERMQQVIEVLQKTSFMQMPAFEHRSVKRSGGLLQHSLNYWIQLERLTEQMGLEWEHPSSPFIIAMLHHACDIGRYYYNWDYKVWEENGKLSQGHGMMSVDVAEKLGIKLTDEEKACIKYHMGDFVESELWESYPDTLIQYPNVAWAHVADLMTHQYYGGLDDERVADESNHP